MSLNCKIDIYCFIFVFENGLFLVCLCEICLIWGFRLQRLYGFDKLILREKVGQTREQAELQAN